MSSTSNVSPEEQKRNPLVRLAMAAGICAVVALLMYFFSGDTKPAPFGPGTKECRWNWCPPELQGMGATPVPVQQNQPPGCLYEVLGSTRFEDGPFHVCRPCSSGERRQMQCLLPTEPMDLSKKEVEVDVPKRGQLQPAQQERTGGYSRCKDGRLCAQGEPMDLSKMGVAN